ncbi:MAG: ABC transporter ATP-binding protein [Lachnospiraceae bacterium]|nr:ABC transporter ATP-binding protein [Lachnospiraceae bacterium]
MKALWKYFKSYKIECISGPLFKLLEASFELMVPLVVKRIIDVGIAYGNREYVLHMVLIMLALAAVGLTCSLTAQYFSAKAAVGFAAKVKNAVFSHIQTLSYTEIDTLGTSTLVTRLTSDINTLQGGVNMSLRLFLRSPFVVAGAVAVAFTIDLKAALTFVVTVLLLSIVVYGIMLITIPMYKKVQTHLDRVTMHTRSALTGVRVTRAFGLEQKEQEEFKETNAVLAGMQILAGKLSALMNPLTFVLINLGLAWLIWEGALAVDTGRLTQGAVVALVNYMSQILVELVKLANMIVQLTRALASAGRISSVLAIEPSMKEGSEAPVWQGGPAEVRFENAAMRYAGSSENGAEGISLRAAAGSTIGIIGGTGSGKTSVIHLIPRFYDAAEGAVYVDGRNVRDYTYRSLRERIAIVPQRSVLFSGTIRENLRWGKADATDAEIMEALRMAQAADFVLEKEGGLDYAVAQGGSNFSGGQRQRLAIARALVRKPAVLILDDSTSALDYATDAALRKAIREMPDSPTTFIVSQRTASIMHADQILVLDAGKVVGLGTHENLMRDCDVYREIYRSQFGREARPADGKGGALQ